MTRYVSAEQGLNHTVIYTDETGKYFRFSGGTFAWRNHNPGNILIGDSSRRNHQIGFILVDKKKFAVFPDRESGHQALLDLLQTNYYSLSFNAAVYKFAPPKENNTV